MNRIGQHWPEFLRDIRDFAELAETESAELGELDAAVRKLFDDQFVETSHEQAVKRREKMLGIQADPATETLAFRKQRILNRYRTKPPFTIRFLQQMLDRLVGPGLAVASVDVQQFILYVTTNIEDANIFKEVLHTVETVKPANMIYQQNTSTRDVVGLEVRTAKQDITWNYALGSWQVGNDPFATLGPEVPIV